MKRKTNLALDCHTIELLINEAKAMGCLGECFIRELLKSLLESLQKKGADVAPLLRTINDYLGTVFHRELQALETGGKAVSASAAPEATNAVAACFEEGLLDRQKPFQLCFLLLAMRARRQWMGVEIPPFVTMVKEKYPQLEQFYGKTEKQIVWCIKKLLAKATHHFYERVHDQVSMQTFIDELYRLKKDGTRRRNGQKAQLLAEKLFLRF